MLTLPTPWNADTADAERDERKRIASPPSFFFIQGRTLVLTASYFSDERLTESARSGVAKKHRHRMHLALYGQLMASFEYLLKDFIAKAVDLTDVLDDDLTKCKWIGLDMSRLLGSRNTNTTIGSILIHPTQSWHYPVEVNIRYSGLFDYNPIQEDEIRDLSNLWILRHSVAHNAGFVTGPDATRLGSSSLSEKVASIDAAFISTTFDFLLPIARRIATHAGDSLLKKWFTKRVVGLDFNRDKQLYAALKHLGTLVESRPEDLPVIDSDDEYCADHARFN